MKKLVLTALLTGLLPMGLSAQTPDFRAYPVAVSGQNAPIEMVAVPGGAFQMGQAAVQVQVEPFWMSATEITHDQFSAFRFEDRDSRPLPEAVSRPTAQYIDLTWGMGKEGGFPANSMKPFTALHYCHWLWKKTGVFYRLPTEAEWEYACLGGQQAATPGQGWLEANSGDAYHKVAQKQPNGYGLYDMLGNVAEWTLDDYDADYFSKLRSRPVSTFYVGPAHWESYHTARGGGFRTAADQASCRLRMEQTEDWNKRDPQEPRSKWWLTDGDFVGFRIVRPRQAPAAQEAEAFFKKFLTED